ncbi:SMP-30/gluconolactonase/LRE family protein [Aldersonia sp. NBC_00410]|uniref:SMP-30/gluconolactonase/LRE family protein n=1 Tax=Aldersonia sp. NBC_00410 TaxID=2975954 RepID=UPI002258D19C|nr:SMP-30/gluconolactonase/LRE family protein [Aldersonia sp. NBC_00410]MCX5044351.1 SMP-30/gluconolactonase/LRE family protein [Aldersonia sp. NBC_00410]
MGILDTITGRLNRVGLEPVAWRAPKPPPLIGDLAPNTELDGAQRWRLPSGEGPEDVVVDHDGRVITGGADGTIWRFEGPGHATAVARTGGRPLGIEILDDGRYLVCDCERGVLRVDDTGRCEVLADSAVGQPLLATNNSAVGRDGTVYFTDSSARFTIPDHKLDILEHGGTGRLLRLDPSTGETDLLAGGLNFANGVGLAADETFVLVAETGSYRITRVDLTGPDAGKVSVWYDNLPGIPDNMTSQGTDGIFWVALFSPRMPLLDLTAPRPALRTIAANLPAGLQPDPQHRGWVLGLDGRGALVHNLQGSKGGFAPITGVRVAGEWMYLGSLEGDSIARIAAPGRGASA